MMKETFIRSIIRLFILLAGAAVTVSSFSVYNIPQRNYISLYSDHPRQNRRNGNPSFLCSSRTPSQETQQQQQQQQQQQTENKKAGEEGYSILRQPLNWDTETDPRFDAPKCLDETKEESYKTRDADWYQSRILGGTNTNRLGEEVQSGEDSKTGQNIIGQQQQQQQQHHRKEEFNQEINLSQRTLDTLDYPIILKALRTECSTKPAQIIINNAIDEEKKGGSGEKKRAKKRSKDDDILSMTLTADNVHGIHERFDAIKEMNAINNNLIPMKKKLGGVPLSNCDFDMEPMMEKIDSGGVLDGPDILEVSTILQSCLKVGEWCMKLDQIERQRKKETENSNTNESGNDNDYYLQNETSDHQETIELKQLPKFGHSIFIDDELVSLLNDAFDDEGRLSGTTFPSIGRLRAKVRTLKNDILGTLDMLMTSPSIKSKVSLESGGAVYSEVNGRIVIPIADKFRSTVGIIHDQSRSGKTAYVEPTEIVGPTNEMRSAEIELRQEEMKVWRRLTKAIKDNREDIERSIAAVAQLDLVMARIRMGDKLDGVVPEVGNEGVISLKDARHPVLLLRELDNVVGSDIDLGAGKNQGLVLTGPNSGGKTVILKLMGLCALMARDGIPIPAKAEGARVDFFNPVLADIGDLQSVDGDLSTFSGHMLVCREVLANSGKNALVLMGKKKYF